MVINGYLLAVLSRMIAPISILVKNGNIPIKAFQKIPLPFLFMFFPYKSQMLKKTKEYRSVKLYHKLKII